MLSRGKYKLKYVGYALAWEFLRNMGIDGAKPDLHMRRILGGDRLGYASTPIATEKEAIEIFDDISRNTKYLKSYIDIVLWSYCADGYGEVCTAEPKCHKYELPFAHLLITH
jgi:thermostable 8-oxoguanine DNA glycosylase